MRFGRCAGRRGPNLRRALTILWEAADHICGKRLKCAIPTLLDPMERHGYLQPSPEIRNLVLAARAATIDRVLISVKQIGKQGRRRTAINTPLRKSIAVRTPPAVGSPSLGIHWCTRPPAGRAESRSTARATRRRWRVIGRRCRDYHRRDAESLSWCAPRPEPRSPESP
jgi:hypothetical protein